MKTFDLRKGVWVCGRVGERASSPAPPAPHTPTPFGHSSKLKGYVLAFLAALTLGLAIPGCAYYSFTGATIPQRLNTVAVPLFEDPSTPFSDLDDALTQNLINRFVGQTRLSLESDENEADAILSGRIGRYESEPASVGGDERASLVRVTVTVEVRYYDNTEDEEMLDRTFSSYAEYDPVADGSDGEREAALAALENIADDIFTTATSDW